MKAKVVEIVNKARAAATTKVADTKQKADVQQIEAEAKLQAIKAQYAALAEEGRSEAQNLDAFDAQRRHLYELKRAQVFEQLASRQKNIVVSGEAGESLLQQLIDVSGDGGQKRALAKK